MSNKYSFSLFSKQLILFSVCFSYHVAASSFKSRNSSFFLAEGRCLSDSHTIPLLWNSCLAQHLLIGHSIWSLFFLVRKETIRKGSLLIHICGDWDSGLPGNLPWATQHYHSTLHHPSCPTMVWAASQCQKRFCRILSLIQKAFLSLLTTVIDESKLSLLPWRWWEGNWLFIFLPWVRLLALESWQMPSYVLKAYTKIIAW